MSDKLNLIQNKNELWIRGILFKPGYRHNMTDCESHIIYKHVPTNTIKEFHGTLWNPDFIEQIYIWIMQFPLKAEQDITLDALKDWIYICSK